MVDSGCRTAVDGIWEGEGAEKAAKSPNEIVINVNPSISGLVELTDDENRQRQKITIKKQKGNPEFDITGKIVENGADAIPYASVKIANSKNVTTTDANGIFILHGNTAKNHVTLSVESIGFETTEVDICLKDTDVIQQDVLYNVQGHVVDEVSDYPLPYAAVTLKNENKLIPTDSAGSFNLQWHTKKPAATLVISSVGYLPEEIPLLLNDSAKTINLGLVRCRLDNKLLTEVVVTAGKVFHCDKVKKTDTIPALIRKVFNTEAFKIYPNPAQRGQTITIDTKKQGEYSIQLFDNNGKLLQVKEFDATEGATQAPLTIPASAAAGIYYIRLVDEKTKKQYTDKVVVM